MTKTYVTGAVISPSKTQNEFYLKAWIILFEQKAEKKKLYYYNKTYFENFINMKT